MHLHMQLKKFGPVPISHQNLMPLLKSFKRPNDKIRDWVQKGYLIPLTKGKYAINAEITGSKPDPLLMANFLYGPSYVSLESALAYYQAIPEAVVETSSVTTGRKKTIENDLGRFSYVPLPLPYYSYGIRMERLGHQQNALIATAEKALFDTVVCTRKLLFRSRRDAERWILDMRLDEDWLGQLNRDRMKRLLSKAPKKESLQHLIKTLTADVA